jgi:DNA-binding LacI/PurR family transcriptional regulator
VSIFPNPQWFRIAGPPLTTHELPLKEMEDMAARLLLQRIDQEDAGQGIAPRAVRFEGRLVVRESTAASRAEPLPQALRAGT